MYRRKSYQERVEALNQKAKDEIYDLFHAKGIKELQLWKNTYVVSETPRGNFDFFPVLSLKLVEQGAPHKGEVLCFGYEGDSGIAWYNNPVIWCQLCDEVRSILKVQ